jgi:hypothetical protein
MHAHVQRLVLVTKMVAVLEEYTTEKQNTVVRNAWAKGLSARGIHKEMFSVYAGQCLSRKVVHS